MLAKQLKLALLGVLIGSTSFCISSANGQQLERPSQRYQPTQVDAAAGEVIHTASQIPSVRVRMSDQANQGQQDKYLIRQVAYQEPVKAPQVPAILAGSSEFQGATRKASSLRDAFQQKFGESKRAASSAIEQAAPLMDQAIQARTPRIAPEEISTQRALLEKQLRDIESRTVAREADLANIVAEKAKASAKTIREAAKPAEDFSASQFLRQINNGEPSKNFESTKSASPQRVSRANYSEPQARTARGIGSKSDYKRQSIRQTSSEDDIESGRSESAAIRLKAPSIEVETFGPRSIGVNKPATYEVVVKNNSGSDAERILVGINLPEWVEVSNVNLTTGGKEVTDGKDKARLVWTIDRIGAGKTQTATILAVPRKAEMFDVGVEWTLVPRTGKANIRVTEPRLTMNISGPAEVEFGEVARYLVTVRNPGTGTAENVTVKLPEALGGERSVLGDIPPGEEEVFQVELLARTAGDLKLVAQASADGEIEASSDRQIVVRRANLAVAMEGPAMKFSGDVGTYTITMTNSGDATANNLMAAVALPTGAKYISGIESVTPIEDGVRWQVGPLEPGQSRDFKVNCQMNGSGDMQLECGVRQGDLAASAACLTRVETVADLVLEVEDPRGPLPTNKNVPYIVTIRNRGSRAAKQVELVMQFSEGIEPNSAAGHQHRIVPGQVLFSPIEVVEPGQEVSFEITAAAHQQGTHIFRAQLTCNDSDSREIAEGTTRYFSSDGSLGESTSTANATSASIGSGDFQR
jgi:uncharacterized repeat protein (TIGR01451 family)